MAISLDPKESLLFLMWCKTQAESCAAIAEQIDKTVGGAVGDQLSRHERQRAMAFLLVAAELSATRETLVVEAEDIGKVDLS